MGHLHDVNDTDNHFRIDPKTRDIFAQSDKLVLTNNDHNSEIYTFELPRYVEGHDMSLCNKIEIHYNNVARDRSTTNSDFYTVTDLKISDTNPEMVEFSWVISNSATQLVGTLWFAIHFECIEKAESVYRWNTSIFKNIKITDGINNLEHLIVKHSDFVDRIEHLTNKSVMEVLEFNNRVQKLENTKLDKNLGTDNFNKNVVTNATGDVIAVPKPVINGVVVEDNKTLVDYGIQPKGDYLERNEISQWAKEPVKPTYTKEEVGLGNVTNDKQIKGLETGTTENHVVTFGVDGYTVKDSGFTIEKSVPADAKFTDTWRGIQDNLSSTSTTESLSANQGKILKGLVDGKANNGHKHVVADITDFPTSMPASDVHTWAKAVDKPVYTAQEVNAEPVGTTATKLGEHNKSAVAHDDIRKLIQGLATKLNTIADSSDVDLDQLSEIVAYIKNNKSLIDSVTTTKLNKNLGTNNNGKVLSVGVDGNVSPVDALTTFSVDKTLGLTDVPADAKAVGDKINELKAYVDSNAATLEEAKQYLQNGVI